MTMSQEEALLMHELFQAFRIEMRAQLRAYKPSAASIVGTLGSSALPLTTVPATTVRAGFARMAVHGTSTDLEALQSSDPRVVIAPAVLFVPADMNEADDWYTGDDLGNYGARWSLDRERVVIEGLVTNIGDVPPGRVLTVPEVIQPPERRYGLLWYAQVAYQVYVEPSGDLMYFGDATAMDTGGILSLTYRL